jgi:hypothetical protein
VEERVPEKGKAGGPGEKKVVGKPEGSEEREDRKCDE